MFSVPPGPWTVQEHIVPASYPRGYRRCVRDPYKSRLKLHVKQYTPHNKQSDRIEEYTPITLLFIHGLGSHKETYEPLLSALVKNPSTPPIRHIFSFDYVNHGQSYMLNKDEIGDETDWLDMARDVLQLVNHFQNEMIAPLVGMAQSYGCTGILASSNWSLRLFQVIVCIEPTVENGWYHIDQYGLDGKQQLVPFPKEHLAKPVTDMTSINSESESVVYDSLGKGHAGMLVFRRRDTWPSLDAARQAFRRLPYFSRYHPDVFEKLMQYDFRPVDPNQPSGAVTLVTPSFLEASYFFRLDPPLKGGAERDYASRTIESQNMPGFYSPGMARIKALMPGIGTRVCYVWSGDQSSYFAPLNQGTHFAPPDYRNRVVEITGTGLGGQGGTSSGQVDQIYVESGGHALPLENPVGTADVIANWLGNRWWPEWQKEREHWKEEARFGKDTETWAEWTKRISKL